MEPSPPAPDPDHQPETTGPDTVLPALAPPIPAPARPKVITTVRGLTGLQVALVMICGNCSFGWPLLGAIAWVAEQWNWSENAKADAIPWAWGIGFAAILTYAYFTNRWAGRADRRAQATIIIGTAVLVGLTILIIPIGVGADGVNFVLVAAMPSLIIQAIVLACVYSREGRRWFDNGGVPDSSPSAGD